MNRFSILVPAVVTALGLSLATSAQAEPPHVASASSSQHVSAPAVSSDHRVIKPGDRNCLQHTGSLIPPKRGECMLVVGKSYSGAELRRTGTQNTARALQTLDPSISVGH